MNAELQNLVQLQDVDVKIASLSKKTSTIPAEIEALEATLQESRQALEGSIQTAEDEKKKRRQTEQDLQALREKLSKFKSQLMEVKTNKEYQAVLHEISMTEEAVARKEDDILELMMASEEGVAAISRREEEYRARESEILGQKKELEEFASQASSQLAEEQQVRAELLARLPDQHRELYERIASARQGVALAKAIDQSCQVCHVRLRPQLFNEVKASQRIITCESCNRILYYPGA